ncbi:MAG: hypothetical protein Q8M40_04700 [Legionella sp.]|nr:hypothetical protein [Legionella sp.]
MNKLGYDVYAPLILKKNIYPAANRPSRVCKPRNTRSATEQLKRPVNDLDFEEQLG